LIRSHLRASADDGGHHGALQDRLGLRDLGAARHDDMDRTLGFAVSRRRRPREDDLQRCSLRSRRLPRLAPLRGARGRLAVGRPCGCGRSPA
jgi:hypothetical protein